MMRSHSWGLAAALAALMASATPVAAQQSLNLSLGGFVPKGEDARVDGDVLLENRTFLLFDFSDFSTGSIGAEWLVPVGQYLEAGVGAGFSRRTVPTIYDAYVDRDGSEIEQDLRLRIVPLTATVRILPLGRRHAFEPYVGGGVGWLHWRYSEVGEFIDFRDFSVFRARYTANGSEVGPVAVMGARFRLGDHLALGGEFRYQAGEADLGEDFLGPKLDLGGYHYLATLQIRF
ncbi:MAG: outer membrane beta-barrel protein [Vicinamibacterales bacterium]|nr:outer membrane beta-barrel protein [Vicinamibacterales bacterium]